MRVGTPRGAAGPRSEGVHRARASLFNVRPCSRRALRLVSLTRRLSPQGRGHPHHFSSTRAPGPKAPRYHKPILCGAPGAARLARGLHPRPAGHPGALGSCWRRLLCAAHSPILPVRTGRLSRFGAALLSPTTATLSPEKTAPDCRSATCEESRISHRVGAKHGRGGGLGTGPVGVGLWARAGTRPWV